MKRIIKASIKNGICLMLSLVLTTQLFGMSAKAETENRDNKGILVEAKSALLMEPSSGKIIYE